MKVLVTGGSGYLGSVLVPLLIEKGHDITVLDKLLYRKETEAKLVVGDIRNEKLMNDLIKKNNAVIHLAGLVGDQLCDMDKNSAININFLATKNIANMCKKNKIKLIFASTCSVYGSQPQTMLRETSVTAPLSVYGLAKLAAEDSIMSLKNQNFKPTIFRMGTLFGYSPRMRFDLVINIFIAQAIKDKKITIYGGKQWRPFLNVKDASEGYLLALESDKFGIFNLGGFNFQIEKIGDIIKKKLNCELKIIKELEDKRNYKVSSKKAEKKIGVKFKGNIESTIDIIKSKFDDKTIDDYTRPIYSNFKSYVCDSDMKRLVSDAK